MVTRGRSELTKKSIENPEFLKFGTPYFTLNDPEIRELEIPAAGGIGTARALARLYCLLGDQKNPLLSKATLEKISKPIRASPNEAVLGMNVSWGHGFMHRLNPNGKYQMGHPGYGGQNAKFDPHENLAYAYLRNSMAPEMLGELVRTFKNLERATYESIRVIKTKS